MQISFNPIYSNQNKYKKKSNIAGEVNRQNNITIKNRQSLANNYVSFKGVDFEKIAEVGRNILNPSNKDGNCPDIKEKFEKELSQIQAIYKERKEKVTGWFKNRKINKLDKEEDTKIKGFLAAQEIVLEEQDAIIALYEKQVKLFEELNASEEDKAALMIALDKEKKVKTAMLSIKEMTEKKNETKGFDSIAGYEEEKFVLTDKFIKYISHEIAGNDVELANSILFFGPTGNGKSSFAKAFAESAGCHFDSVSGGGRTRGQKEKAFMNNLIDKAEKAQEEFEKTRVRTILLVDEFDNVAYDGSSILGDLKQFMQDCSEEYHVTLFATSNDPLNINSAIRGPKRMPIKVSLDPPNTKNSAAVLEHYLKTLPQDKVNLSNINFKELGDKISEVGPDQAYNNSQLETICKNCCEDSDGQITQFDVTYQIDSRPPGIKKEKLDKYNLEKAQLTPNNGDKTDE